MSIRLSPPVPGPLRVEARLLPIRRGSAALALPHLGMPLCAWLGADRSILGVGEALRIEALGPDAGSRAAREWERICVGATVDVQAPAGTDFSVPTLPVALGSFGFAPHTPGVLIVPAFALVSHAGRLWQVRVRTDHEPLVSPRAPREVFPPGSLTVFPGSLTEDEWAEAVGALTRRLRAGQAKKVVLARDVEVRTKADVDLRFLLERLHERYPTCWTYVVDGLVGATPEMLARVRGGQVFARVLAGTAAPDCGAQLSASVKDQAEHTLAVQSVAQVLAPLCSELEVPASPSVLSLPNVVHLSSDVCGVLADGLTSLDVAAALHPTAAVCGTPREAARQMLAEYEQMNRGRYAGPVGWIDAAGEGEWGIALRCAMINNEDPRSLRVIAGAGIMPDSDPLAEVAETRAKMRPIFQALDLSEDPS